MRRLKKLYYLPIYILVFLSTVRVAQAISIIDVGGGVAIGFAVGGPVGAIVGGIIGAILGFFGVGVEQLAKDIVTVLFKWGFSLIAAIVNAIAGVFFALGAALVNFAIALSQSLAESEIVQLGHDVVLAFANLGLVAGIIIIAFMVMFRRANAGPQLIRFIAAALLINFSFFIITQVFIAPIDAVTSVLNDAANYNPASFAKIFRPGGDYIDDMFRPGASEVEVPEGWFTDIAVGFAELLFVVAFAFIGTLTLFAFAVMLFVRYIALGLLIILMPLAWIAWVFPTLKIPGGNPWSQWWSQFTKWLLFAPIGMFFFFLSVRAVNSNVLTTDVEGTNPEVQGLAAVGDMLIITGLLLGGLIVANKMSITGSSYAMAVGKKGGNWAKAKGKLMAIGTVSAPFRTERGKKFTEKTQQLGASRGLMGRLMTAPVRAGGRGLNVLGAKGEQAIKKRAEEDIKVLEGNPVRLAQATPSLRGAKLARALDTLRKEKSLGLIPEESGGIARLIGNPGVEKLYKRLGRGGDYEDLEKAAGFNTAVINAARAFEEGTGTLDDLRQAVEAFQRATYQSAKDVDALQPRIFRPGNQYGLQDTTRQVIAERLGLGLLEQMPETTVRLRTKMDGAELGEFQKIFDARIQTFEAKNLPARLQGLRVDTKDKLNELDAQVARLPAGSGAAAAAVEDARLARKLYKEYERMLGGGLLFERPAPAAPATP